MDTVRNLLIDQGIVDTDGFEEYTNELQINDHETKNT
jgi:hypothetical protein